MIKVDNLNFSYENKKVVKDINFSITEGKSWAIIGPSGCGKTTLIYLLAGLLEPDQGMIKINDKIINNIREETGVILQNYGLFPWKTVHNNVALGLKVRNYQKGKIEKIVLKVLKRLGIDNFKDKYPAELSGGQNQRVAVARTLVLNPDLLLMDEPFSALDAITREEMQNLILKIHQENNLSYLIVTHNIDEAVFLGQKIAVMKEGEFIHQIDNPYFGDIKLREKEEFFQLCKKLRIMMSEDDLL
ncbi:MAG TPA: ABC transporter ATP-binding protein [Halanaerobiales bacterium]|nr:ABC transporter ATP-binding protein [Halanaerobiales bacterium]